MSSLLLIKLTVVVKLFLKSVTLISLAEMEIFKCSHFPYLIGNESFLNELIKIKNNKKMFIKVTIFSLVSLKCNNFLLQCFELVQNSNDMFDIAKTENDNEFMLSMLPSLVIS